MTIRTDQYRLVHNGRNDYNADELRLGGTWRHYPTKQFA